MSDILTVKQAAAFLQVSEDVLYPMLARREIPAGKVRGQWRLVQQDLIEWLRAQYSVESTTKELEQCRTAEQGASVSGSLSAEYDALLGLKTSKPQRRSKTS